MSHNQNGHGGKRQGAGRKSTWTSGCSREDTKSIRVPKKIADKVMSFAHINDSVDSCDVINFPCVDLENKDKLPSLPAIYFVLNQANEIQYIGQSKDLLKRWKSHHKLKDLKNVRQPKIAYLIFNLPDLLYEVEQALIEYFNPPLNLDTRFKLKGDEKRKVRSMRVTDEVWQKWGDLAAEKNMTRADYLEWITKEYIRQKESKNKGLEILEEALKLKANAGGAIKKKIREYLILFRN